MNPKLSHAETTAQGGQMKRPRVRKLHVEFTCLFHRDGWCLGRWHGWFPEFDRERYHNQTCYRLQIGPALLVIAIIR